MYRHCQIKFKLSGMRKKGHGPLQGLAAGIKTLIGQVDAVFLSSCDVPFLRLPVRRLLELVEDNWICVFHTWINSTIHWLQCIGLK